MDVEIILKILKTTKTREHIPCWYWTSRIMAFNNIENRYTLYHGEDCMKKFCESLREHTKTIIDFEKIKMLFLTKEELESHQMQKYVTFVEKES